jgi:hypothetical protein
VAGRVQDTFYRFIPDVRITAITGSQVGASTMTDASGQFELPGPFTGEIDVRAEKAGYVSVTRHVGPLPYSGLFPLFFWMEFDVPSVNLTGDWNVTLHADASCTGVPDALRTRTYTATVDPLSFRTQNYKGLLSGADFGNRQPEVYINVAGPYASFYIEDPWGDHGGTHVVEKLTPSGYVAIWGGGEGSVSESRVAGSFPGWFEYCARSDSNLNCEVDIAYCSPSALTMVRR